MQLILILPKNAIIVFVSQLLRLCAKMNWSPNLSILSYPEYRTSIMHQNTRIRLINPIYVFDFNCSLNIMGSVGLDNENVGTDVYFSLGLKQSGKVATKIPPRVLSPLSSLLERSVQSNEMHMEATEIKEVTIFHGLRAPPLSIRQYIDRVFKYSGCSPSCFVVAKIYVDRYLQSTQVHLTSFNVHRLLITSVMLAAKFIDDA